MLTTIAFGLGVLVGVFHKQLMAAAVKLRDKAIGQRSE